MRNSAEATALEMPFMGLGVVRMVSWSNDSNPDVAARPCNLCGDPFSNYPQKVPPTPEVHLIVCNLVPGATTVPESREL